jgi:hypothetical protein
MMPNKKNTVIRACLVNSPLAHFHKQILTNVCGLRTANECDTQFYRKPVLDQPKHCLKPSGPLGKFAPTMPDQQTRDFSKLSYKGV